MGERFKILLFYKFVDVPAEAQGELVENQPRSVKELQEWLQKTCEEKGLLGRIIVSTEGINGNLASHGEKGVDDFCEALNQLMIFKDANIDFKMDFSDSKPFPDLFIQEKKEICSTGNAMPKELMDKGFGGTHLSPEDFHKVIHEYWVEKKGDGRDLVVIDVRNNVEFKTGRFIAGDGHEAVNPSTKMFSRWAPDYADKAADELKKKKVLMYCTGGIRCEKASAYLRSIGVDDVSQLSGGIHRYLEKFGSDGYFKGSNFVFDSRTLQKPEGANVVGKCHSCESPTETVSCDRCCSVCREPVLVCDSCRVKLYGVYYCDLHQDMKGLYEPFLERFDINELEKQKEALLVLLKNKLKGSTRRRPVSKQLRRIDQQIERKKQQEATAKETGKKIKKTKWGSYPRCRSCGMIGPKSLLEVMGREFNDESVLCDGNCVGFVRENYENPKSSLDEMNDPSFGAPEKKRKRTQKNYRDFAKRMRNETHQEYETTQYNIVNDVAISSSENDPNTKEMHMTRCVEPYFFHYQTHVKERWRGRSLLDIYSAEFSGSKLEYLRKAITVGLIKVNGKKASPDQTLVNGDLITNLVHRHEPPVEYVKANDMIVKETDRLLVIDKPASLTIHPSGAFRRNSVTFILAVERGFTQLYPVHRLDRVTSGLVLIGKDPEIAKRITEAMVRKSSPNKATDQVPAANTRVQKAYLARVHGKFPSSRVDVDVVLSKVLEKYRVPDDSLPDQSELRKFPKKLSEEDEYLESISIRPPGLYFEENGSIDPFLDLNLTLDPTKRPVGMALSDHLVFSWPMQQVCQHTGTWRCFNPDEPLPAESSTIYEDNDPSPKSSMTRFRMLGYDAQSDTSLVQCEPVTGRTHQLRVHLSFLGFPILHDPIYGIGGDVFAGKTLQHPGNTTGEEMSSKPVLLKDDSTLTAMMDEGDEEGVAQALCISCVEGLGAAFKPVQMRSKGIDLHAFRYVVTLPDGSNFDFSTKLPKFAEPFT